jgi:hypothetical protein
VCGSGMTSNRPFKRMLLLLLLMIIAGNAMFLGLVGPSGLLTKVRTRGHGRNSPVTSEGGSGSTSSRIVVGVLV